MKISRKSRQEIAKGFMIGSIMGTGLIFLAGQWPWLPVIVFFTALMWIWPGPEKK